MLLCSVHSDSPADLFADTGRRNVFVRQVEAVNTVDRSKIASGDMTSTSADTFKMPKSTDDEGMRRGFITTIILDTLFQQIFRLTGSL